MARSWITYTCAHCKKETKTVPRSNELKFGVPFYKCPHCGLLNYDDEILEPALLAPMQFEAPENERMRTSIVFLVYFGIGIFLAVSLLVKSFLLSALLVGIPAIVLLVLIIRKRRSFNIDRFAPDIQKSMLRLEKNEKYAAAVIKLQGIDPGSAWEKKYGRRTD